MSGYCEVDFGDYSDEADPVELYDDKIVVGRKAYTCDECGGAIAKGESHQRKSYRFDGKFQSERICDGCREVAGEFDHRFVGGMLWLSFEGEWDNGATLQGCLNRLTSTRAKSTMRERWAKWDERRQQQRREAAQRRTRERGAVDPNAGIRER